MTRAMSYVRCWMKTTSTTMKTLIGTMMTERTTAQGSGSDDNDNVWPRWSSFLVLNEFLMLGFSDVFSCLLTACRVFLLVYQSFLIWCNQFNEIQLVIWSSIYKWEKNKLATSWRSNNSSSMNLLRNDTADIVGTSLLQNYFTVVIITTKLYHRDNDFGL